MAVGQVGCVTVIILATLLNLVSGYIPAQPSNDTTGQNIVGLPPNQTDTSLVILNWFPSKSTQEQVSYQIVGNNSNGLSQGALVHFSEHNLTNSTDEYSATPWIAFVACDANATNESLEDDIFTLAQARGALSALLYSQYSNSCIINPEYADPENFAQLFDVFSTKKLVDAQLIESQYTNIALEFSTFNASLLNASVNKIETSVAGGPTGPGYLMATLIAANATAQPNSSTPGEPHPRSNSNSSSGGTPNTGLAMIILYAITGCVSALFCVVIISGAIRAVRNPDRYGPRADDTLGGGRSRTAGLGRAILDTFPIIKFGQSETTPVLPRVDQKTVPKHDDSHASPMIELVERRRSSRSSQIRASDIEEQNDLTDPDQEENDEPRERRASTSRSTAAPASPNISQKETESNPLIREAEVVNPENIGHETCPICILDFEEGDDLRVLPCEGKHRFHQACVDPWLLEMSSSCPLCREDFWTLESMVRGEQPEAATSAPAPAANSSGHPGLIATPHDGAPPRSTRLGLRGPLSSKYLRFAQRRRSRAVQEAANGQSTSP